MISLYPSKNRSLARLATLSRNSWLEIKTPQLPKSLASQLDNFFSVIAGETMGEDLTTLLVAFDKDTSVYTRTYAPSIYSDTEGNPVVVWGNNFYPLTANILETLDAQVSLEELEKYQETVLILSIEVEDDFLELPLQLRLDNNRDDIKLSDLKKLVKNIRNGKADPKDLGAVLYTREKREKKDFKPTFAMGDLKPEVLYSIKSAELKEFGSHSNYIVTAIDSDTDEEIQFYSPRALRDALEFGAIIDPDKTTMSFVVKEGKKRPQYFVSLDGLQWPEDEDIVQI